MNNNKSMVAKWSLIVGIVILFNLFINVSMSLIYQSANYSDFCANEMRYPKLEMEQSEAERIAEMQEWEKCQKEWEVAREAYERKVFITLVSIGVIIFAISLIGSLNYVVATSLSLASVLNFIIASMRYWSSADEILKVIILGLALAVLVWIGIKKFSDK